MLSSVMAPPKAPPPLPVTDARFKLSAGLQLMPVFLAFTGAPAHDSRGKPLWLAVHPSHSVTDVENGLRSIMGCTVKLAAPYAEDANANILDLCATQGMGSLRVVL